MTEVILKTIKTYRSPASTINTLLGNPMTNPPKDPEIYAKKGRRQWEVTFETQDERRYVYQSHEHYHEGRLQRARERTLMEKILQRGEKLKEERSGRTVRLIFI